MSEVLREKCAVAAMSSHLDHDVAPEMYEVLFAMQHRGVEASGIASYNQDGMSLHTGSGMVRDVYDQDAISKLAGSTGVGHNRYTTSGRDTTHNQPVFDASINFSFAHNGNLPDTDNLDEHLQNHNFRTKSMNDSVMMSSAISQLIRDGNDLPTAVEKSYDLFKGSFSCVAMHDGLVVAFRDECGIRPLAIGQTNITKTIVSETCALDIIGADYLREVEPGEMVVIQDNAIIAQKQLTETQPSLDMFELVYFARHDSYLYGQSVNEVRRRFGERLAEEHPPAFEASEDTLVVPVPDTSVPAAEGYADALGLRHRQAIIKNRFIGRSFMQPTDDERKALLRRKHNIIPESVAGKNVVLIDDSIVRLNTMPRLVALAKEAGAKTVQVLVASPPVRFPDYYGIDTPQQSELAAAQLTIEEIREATAADYLGYLSLSGMVESTGIEQSRFNLSCFNGEYPIDIGKRTKEIKSPVSMEGAD